MNFRISPETLAACSTEERQARVDLAAAHRLAFMHGFSEGMPPRRYGPGDVIFFRRGAHAKWHVEGYVKKVAFFRQTNPFGLGLAVRAVNRIMRIWYQRGTS